MSAPVRNGAGVGPGDRTKRPRAHVWEVSADGARVVCGVCFATLSVAALAVVRGKPVVRWRRTGGVKCSDARSARRKRERLAQGAKW